MTKENYEFDDCPENNQSTPKQTKKFNSKKTNFESEMRFWNPNKSRSCAIGYKPNSSGEGYKKGKLKI